MSELATKTHKPSSPAHKNQGDRQHHSANTNDLFIQPKEGPNTFFAPTNFIQSSNPTHEERNENDSSKTEGIEGQNLNGTKRGFFGEPAFFQPQVKPITSAPAISKKDEEPAQNQSSQNDSESNTTQAKPDQTNKGATPNQDQTSKENENTTEGEEKIQEDTTKETVSKDVDAALPDKIENPYSERSTPPVSNKVTEEVEKDIDAEVEQLENIESPKKSPDELPNPEKEKAPEKNAETKGEEIKSEGKKNKNAKNAAFKGVISKIKGVSKEQKQHDPAEKLSGEAQSSAPAPDNERKSQAQANVVEGMDAEAKEPKEFKAEVFKAKLMKRINEMTLPKNLEEADEFKNNNKLDDVNKAAMGDVNQQKEETVGSIDQATNQEPNAEAIPAKEVKPLRPVPEGEKPKSVNADAAIPNKRPNAEIKKPVEENTQRLDDAMAENQVTDEQLANSEEPKFVEALENKGTAKKQAKTGPAKVRQEEKATLDANAQKAEGTSQEQLEAMNMMRGSAVSKVVGGQQETATKDTSERARIANEINVIYEKAKTDVNKILSDLDTEVAKKFKAASDKAKRAFENYCANKMAAYKRKRYSGALGKGRWLKDVFMDLPDEVNQFYVDGKKRFKQVMEAEITKIAEIVARKLNEAKRRVETGKKEVTDYVNALPANLKTIGKDAAQDIQDKFDELSEDVDSKQDDLIETLASEYKASLDEVDARIEEMKEANKGLVSKAMDMVQGVIETIKKLKQAISNLLSAISSVIPIIIAAPIKFMGDLFTGIGKGIDMFKANIQKHLMGGLLEWLTGSLGPLGIQMPDDIFSLKGIFSLVMQVLGLGWDYLRLKAVKMMGEPVVSALESGWDMFKTFSKNGVMGMWEYMKDKFGDLKETVMDAIKDMLITKVIEAGIKWLLSLLIPGAGFIKAVMAIKDLIVFFVESAIMLIPAITEAILALAAGSLAGVGKAIELGLSKLISLVIGLFAKLIGLGGLSKKVTKIFKKLRKRVDRAVNKILKKARKAGRKLMRKLGIGKDGKKKKKKETEKEIKESGNIAAETFQMAGSNHTLSVNKGKVYMASKKGQLGVKLRKAKKEASKADENAYDGKKQHVVSSLGGLESAMNNTNTQLSSAIKAKDNKKIKKAQKSFRALADNIGKFGTKYGFKDLTLEATNVNDSSAKGIFNKNKANVHASALKTVEKTVVNVDIEQAKKKKGGVQSWNGLKGEIKKTAPAENLHEHPLTTSDNYGKHTREQAAESAKRVIKDRTQPEIDDIVKDQLPKIEKNKSSLAFVALRDQVLDKSRKADVEKRLDSVFRGEESDHTDYKIVASDLDFDGTSDGKLVVKYNYTIQQAGQPKETRSFTVTMEPKGGSVSHKILGKNLGIKDPGRGSTVSASNKDSREALKNAKTNPNNQLDQVTSFADSEGTAFDSKDQREGVASSEYYSAQDSVDTIKFNASHLIADWFNGSGYASALNLAQTSEYYNKEVMGKMEKRIVEELKDEQANLTRVNSNVKYITFNALVTSEWMEITDNKIGDKIKSETATAMKAGSKEEKETILKKLVIDLGKERDPKFCKGVHYAISGVVAKNAEGKNSGMSSSYKFNEKIGEDTHLKDVLK
ncbi:MAG: hypothetical protein HWE22_10640 [Flavobacteriales bacterium]|nr:hypothetical protein [Flavobacteriales bacterium]